MSMNFELARHNMIEQQVRPWDVLDQNVLAVLARVPREEFVPAAYRQLAFTDMALPLGYDQSMLRPVIEGRLLQALDLASTASVLEVGTGSGFMTACLAALAPKGRITSVDIQAEFIEQARPKLHAAGFRQVELHHADIFSDFQPTSGFDAIVLTGAVAELPERLLRWLNPGGRLIAVHGYSPVQKAVRLSKAQGQALREEELFETDLPYLIHAEPRPSFKF